MLACMKLHMCAYKEETSVIVLMMSKCISGVDSSVCVCA